MAEIDLLANYPKTKRNLDERAAGKTEEDRAIGRQFGFDYFDGDRKHGYGGFSYQPRFWQPVIPDFQKHFGLTKDISVLDVGCGKGFMLHDLQELIPGITVRGVDISEYAIEHAMEDVKPFVSVANATKLPFEDNSYDVVISINTIHNLPIEECKEALREIERVSRGKSFITVDAYHTEEEKERMDKWNLTALTYMSVPEWEELFKEVGYTGDYFWFIP
ncbi:MAG TPA: class I SAM-dependent methyltransferase [Candidatus Andersenbacteria bacterium]|nr:class I SAM-dependent methyltransferase [Candidatus Andersenbacteria bacterium]